MRVIYHPEVEKIIRFLQKQDESRVLKVVDLFLEYKFNLTQLYLKKIVKKIWELRAGRYRLLFGIVEKDVVIVDIFIKKSQKTPKQSIKVAMRRLKEYEQ